MCRRKVPNIIVPFDVLEPLTTVVIADTTLLPSLVVHSNSLIVNLHMCVKLYMASNLFVGIRIVSQVAEWQDASRVSKAIFPLTTCGHS